MFQRFKILIAVLVMLAAGLAQAQARTQLILVERDDCHWCEVWEAEVGIHYDSTPVARIAPIRRVDKNRRKPNDIAHIRLGRYTPTFILVHDGRDLGRIRGYPGKAGFWSLLKELLQRLPANEQNHQPQAKKIAYPSSKK